MNQQEHSLIILGSGPAGLTAAIYAARAELKPILIAGDEPGGQLMLTTDVENYPGFPEGINGPDLMQNMIKQAERFGTKIIYDSVNKVDLQQQPFTVKTPSHTLHAKALIIATGASARWLGLESETKLRGKGISTCATCDGAFFKDKTVYVVGGGDSAMEEALFLTKFASSVTILVRKGKNKLRASKIMQQRAFDHEKIDVRFHTQVKEVLGEEKVTGLRLIQNQTNEEENVQADGLFIAIGHDPNTKIFKNLIPMNEQGYLQEHDHTKSNIEGVFIAGDVSDDRYRQAVTAAGAGCMAAMDAEKYLEQMKHENSSTA